MLEVLLMLALLAGAASVRAFGWRVVVPAVVFGLLALSIGVVATAAFAVFLLLIVLRELFRALVWLSEQVPAPQMRQPSLRKVVAA